MPGCAFIGKTRAMRKRMVGMAFHWRNVSLLVSRSWVLGESVAAAGYNRPSRDILVSRMLTEFIFGTPARYLGQ